MKNKILCFLIIGLLSINSAFCQEFGEANCFNCIVKIDGIENDPSVVYLDDNNEIKLNLDVSSLTAGMHSLSMQFISHNGYTSSQHNAFFVRTEVAKEWRDVRCEYSIDTTENPKEAGKFADGTFHFDLDTNALNEGLHTLYYSLLSDEGEVVDLHSAIFYKEMKSGVALEGNVKCMYSIDNTENPKEAGEFADGTFHFDLDATSLTEGLHTLYYSLLSDEGEVLDMQYAIFYKEIEGGVGLRKYEYRINGESSNQVSVDIPENADSFSLLDLLQVPKQEIRSSEFRFEVSENDVPTVYAVNDLEFFVYDNMGRMSYETAKYIDYSTSHKLTDAQKLQSLLPVVKPKPGKNEMQWYKVEAAQGDSLSFMVDKACWLQVFSPTGKEVLNVTGSKVREFNGIHAFEKGDYYLALHDVTATTNTTTLTYQHIDRYAVLSRDVKKVGNGGWTTIKFLGNGYHDLESIRLTDGKTTIPWVETNVINNGEMDVTFDFTDVPIGKYDFKLKFSDDTLTIPFGIEVEEATALILSSDVIYQSSYLRGTSTTFTLNFTNHGNNTAYFVPVPIYIETEGGKTIDRISLRGFLNQSWIENVDPLDFAPGEYEKLLAHYNQVGDLYSFSSVNTADDGSNDGKNIYNAYCWVTIPPESTISTEITVKGTGSFNLSAQKPEEWGTFPPVENDESTPQEPTPQDPTSQTKPTHNSHHIVKETFCCYHEHIECLASMVSIVADIVNRLDGNVSKTAEIVQCVSSSISLLSTITSFFICEQRKTSPVVTGIKIAGIVSTAFDILNSCWLKQCDKIVANGYLEGISSIIQGINGLTCAYEWASGALKKKDCPPWKYKDYQSMEVASFDPNDIIGYVAPSGDKYVGVDVKRLQYILEFENDSAVATAPAHKIVLKNKLPKGIFDQSSIRTSKLTLGNKEFQIGEQGEFTRTFDLRPETDALAEISLSINEDDESLEYTLLALDPMTVEPIDNVDIGVLPVNNSDGDGNGQIIFDIAINEGIKDGTPISNYAEITFDSNDVIETPEWYNETDYVRPNSVIMDIENLSEDRIRVHYAGVDARSGIWKYDVYMRPGNGSDWFLLGENVENNFIDLDVYRGVNYGFCAIAYDRAGNREDKKLQEESFYCDGDISTQILTTKIREDQIPESFDLQGIKNIGKKRSGIYIINGQKILIK